MHVQDKSGAGGDAGISVELEVFFATACAITSWTVFSSRNSLDAPAFSNNNVPNVTYALSIVEQDDNNVISKQSSFRD